MHRGKVDPGVSELPRGNELSRDHVTGPYSIRSTWSCYRLDQFLTLALNILILSIFYISMDLSTNYFAHFSGC